ncbi:alpha/beta fold hydrolase [Shimazuella kribbensis]|uniref:alpha/beta fold hydrolase n=1 Tax=Shimazuella kribbensis TaxID=139808 RepID=UPI000428B6DF|nr:alpha/beta hydrolase [Shimazuella kribbensis]
MEITLAEKVETSFVKVNEVTYAYRLLGKKSDVPLVLCHRFRGTMDDWDPAIVDLLSKERTVILFDNAGVGLSTGVTPNNIPEMANHAVIFMESLGFDQVDLLGFSMGGCIAQQVTLERPDLVRSLILAGTGPGGGEGIQSAAPEVFQVAMKPVNVPEDFLYLFFEQTETSQVKGKVYLERLQKRKEDRSPFVSEASVKAQAQALMNVREKNFLFPRLGEIKQPVLIMNGNDDIMIPAINSYIMSQHIKNAQLIIYPDAGHGFLFQYPELFTEHVSTFLKNV